MLHAYCGESLQKLRGRLGKAIDPLFNLGKQLAPSAFDHVAEQRPGRATEANQWHPPLKSHSREGDCLIDVIEVLRKVHRAVHNPEIPSIRRGQRGGEMRSLLIDHLHRHPHRLWDDQDIREDDGGIDESSIAIDGLQRQCACYLRCSTALEEVPLPFHLVILR